MSFNYPRVTTIIRDTEPPEKRQALMRWEKKMQQVHGIDGAKTEHQKILDNGTNVHTSIEKFLADDPLQEGMLPQLRPMFGLLNKIKVESPRLLIENQLYSHKYKFQGKSDLVCIYNEKWTVVDWTTSYQKKSLKYLDHKFIQAGAYAIALEEKKIRIQQLMVVVLVDTPSTYQIFTECPRKWRIEFLKRLGQYRRLQQC
jgi:ATP-dependent exoDNAse (exonuclease V) beta subunit